MGWAVRKKKKVCWRKLGDQSMVGFHWPDCDCLLLAELLPSKEKNLPSSASGKAVSLPAGDEGTAPPVRICVDVVHVLSGACV